MVSLLFCSVKFHAIVRVKRANAVRPYGRKARICELFAIDIAFSERFFILERRYAFQFAEHSHKVFFV